MIGRSAENSGPILSRSVSFCYICKQSPNCNGTVGCISFSNISCAAQKIPAHFAVVFLVAAALAAACSGSGPVAAVFGGAAIVLLIGVGTASGYREYRKRQLLSLRWVLSFLKARDLDPEKDADGDVLFLLDNMKYVLHIKEHYFELHIGFGRKRSELNDELMTRMAQEVMSSTRMVKILLRPKPFSSRSNVCNAGKANSPSFSIPISVSSNSPWPSIRGVITRRSKSSTGSFAASGKRSISRSVSRIIRAKMWSTDRS